MKLFACLSLPVCLLWAAAPASAQNFYAPQPQVFLPQGNPAVAPQANPYYAGYAPVVYANTATRQPTPIAAQRQDDGAGGFGRFLNPPRTHDPVASPLAPSAEEIGVPESYGYSPEPLNVGDNQYGNFGDNPYGCADGSCDLKNWRRHFACKGGWYGSLAGLYMTRDMPNRYVYATDSVDLDDVRLTNRDAEPDWEGGYEITFGRCIGHNSRIELGYWEIDGMDATAWVPGGANGLVSTYDFQGVHLDADELSIFFDASNGQDLFRFNRFRNIELNLYHRPCSVGAFDGYGGYGGCGDCGSCCRWNVELLAGLRYFNFDERLIWGSVDPGLNFGDNGGINEAYIVSDVENHLFGFQIGALVDYYFTKKLSVFAKPKVGIYGNHSKVDFNVYRGDGEPGRSDFSGEYFPVRDSKNDVSLLAELEIGARWDISCHWSVFASYRALAVTGVALSDEQIPFYVVDMQDVRSIDTNSELILHGATFGVQFAY